MQTQTLFGLSRYCAIGLMALSLPAVSAEATATPDPWTLKLTPQVSYTGYGAARWRNDMISTGLYFDAQYQDLVGFSGGASYTRLNFKAGLSALNQAAEYLSGRINFAPDFLPGRLTLRLDGHQINNDDSTNESNDVQVIAPQVLFLSHGKSLYLDLGYAASFYGHSDIGNGSLTVQQWTPTLGLGFNNQHDWLQLRLYDVSASNVARAFHSHTDAVEIKLTHYFAPQSAWVPYWIGVGGLVGSRMYAVDGDTALVYNLADEQKGGGFVAAQWKLTEHYRATASASYDLYQTSDTVTGDRNEYSGVTGYFGLTAQW